MASSVSILNNYDPTLFTFGNKDLLMQGLMMKQGAYDINKNKIDQLKSQVTFLNIDESKKQDVDYINNRLKVLDDVIKTPYEMGDLSNSSLVEQITSRIEDVVDAPIFNMTLSKRIKDMENASWQEAMDRNDGSYSDLNRSVMSRNYQKWLDDGKVGSRYTGGGGFVKFVDIDKMYMSKEFNDYLKNAGINAEYIVQNGIGQFSALDKMEGTVDQNRLRQAIETYMGEDGRRQMKINAIAQYGYGDNQEGVTALQQVYEARNNSYLEAAESRLNALNTALSGKMSPNERQMYEQEKSNLEMSITATQSKDFSMDVLGEDGLIDENRFTQVANNIYSNNKMDALFNMTYMSPIWKDRKLDEVQAKTVEFEWDKQKFQLNYDLSLRKHQLNLAKEGFTEDEEGNLVPLTTANGLDASLNTANVRVGEGSEVTNIEADNLNIESEAARQYINAIQQIAASQNQDWNESRTARLENYLLANNGFAPGDIVDIGNGKTFEITASNISAVRQLNDAINNTNSTVAKVANSLVDAIGIGGDSKGGNIDWNVIRNRNDNTVPNIYFVKNESGDGFIAKSGVMPGSRQSNLNYLAYKITEGKELTPEEQMTADYYKTKVASATMNLNDTERKLLDRTIYRRMNGNVNSLKDVERTNVVDVFNQSSSGYVDAEVSRLPSYRNLQTSSKEGVTITAREINDRKYGIFAQSISNNIKTAYETQKDAILTESRGLIERDRITISPKISSDKFGGTEEARVFNNVRSKIGIDFNYNGYITLERVIKNAKPTNKFKILLDEVALKKSLATSGEDFENFKTMLEGKTITEDELKSLKVYTYNQQPTPYNTELGAMAAKTEIKPSNNFFVKNIDPNSPKIFSSPVKDVLNAFQEQVRMSRGDNFDIYQYINNTKGLSDLNVVIQPAFGQYYTTIGGTTFGKPLGKNVDGSVIDNAILTGDILILKGLAEKIKNDFGVEINY